MLARILAAAALGAMLLWASHAQGRVAADVRHAAHTWLMASTLPELSAKPQSGPRQVAKSQNFAWPVYGVVTTRGDDVMVSAPGGTLVHAAAAGTVTQLAEASPGVVVTVRTGNVSLSYVHLGPSYVRKGEEVTGGQAIGEITHFPPATQPNLVLQAKENGKAVPVLGLLGAP